jgi:uncharacterized membrane protein
MQSMICLTLAVSSLASPCLTSVAAFDFLLMLLKNFIVFSVCFLFDNWILGTKFVVAYPISAIGAAGLQVGGEG